MKVERNRAYNYLSKMMGKSGKHTDNYQYFDETQKKVVRFPRIGAFQVYFENIIIFSHLRTNLSPEQLREFANLGEIIADVIRIIEKNLNNIDSMKRLESFRYLELEWKPIPLFDTSLLDHVFSFIPDKDLTRINILRVFRQLLNGKKEFQTANEVDPKKQMVFKESCNNEKPNLKENREIENSTNFIPYTYYGQNEKFSRIKSIYNNSNNASPTNPNDSSHKKKDSLQSVRGIKSRRSMIRRKYAKENSRGDDNIRSLDRINFSKTQLPAASSSALKTNFVKKNMLFSIPRPLAGTLPSSNSKLNLNSQLSSTLMYCHHSVSPRSMPAEQRAYKHKDLNSQDPSSHLKSIINQTYDKLRLEELSNPRTIKENNLKETKSIDKTTNRIPKISQQKMQAKLKEINFTKNDETKKRRALLSHTIDRLMLSSRLGSFPTRKAQVVSKEMEKHRTKETLKKSQANMGNTKKLSRPMSLMKESTLKVEGWDDQIMIEYSNTEKYIKLQPEQERKVSPQQKTKKGNQGQSQNQNQNQNQIQSQSSNPNRQNLGDSNFRIEDLIRLEVPIEQKSPIRERRQQKPRKNDFIKKNIQNASRMKKLNRNGVSDTFWEKSQSKLAQLQEKERRNCSFDEKSLIQQSSFANRKNHEDSCKRCQKKSLFLADRDGQKPAKSKMKSKSKRQSNYEMTYLLKDNSDGEMIKQKGKRRSSSADKSSGLKRQGGPSDASDGLKKSSQDNCLTEQREMTLKKQNAYILQEISSSRFSFQQESGKNDLFRYNRFLNMLKSYEHHTKRMKEDNPNSRKDIQTYLKGMIQRQKSNECRHEQERQNPQSQLICYEESVGEELTPGQYNFQMLQSIESTLKYESAYIVHLLDYVNQEDPSSHSQTGDFKRLLEEKDYAKLEELSQFSFEDQSIYQSFKVKPLSEMYKLDELQLFPSSKFTFNSEQTYLYKEERSVLAQVVSVLMKINKKILSRLFQNVKSVSFVGFYCIWLFTGNNKFEPINVNDEFAVSMPSKDLLYSSFLSQNSIWFMLLEKAVAKVLGGYEKLGSSTFGQLFKILTGCQIVEMKDLTPQKFSKIFNEKIFNNKKAFVYAVSSKLYVEREQQSERKCVEKIIGSNYEEKNPNMSLIHFESSSNNRINSITFIDFLKEFSYVTLAFFNPNFHYQFTELEFASESSIHHLNHNKKLSSVKDQKFNDPSSFQQIISIKNQEYSSSNTCYINVSNVSKDIDSTCLKIFHEVNTNVDTDEDGTYKMQSKQVYRYNGEITKNGNFFFEVTLKPGNTICIIEIQKNIIKSGQKKIGNGNGKDFSIDLDKDNGKSRMNLCFYSECSVNVERVVDFSNFKDLNGKQYVANRQNIQRDVALKPKLKSKRKNFQKDYEKTKMMKNYESRNQSKSGKALFFESKNSAIKSKLKRKMANSIVSSKIHKFSESPKQAGRDHEKQNYQTIKSQTRKGVRKERMHEINQLRTFVEDDLDEERKDHEKIKIKKKTILF